MTRLEIYVWSVAGLALLAAVSMTHPLDIIFGVVCAVAAIAAVVLFLNRGVPHRNAD